MRSFPNPQSCRLVFSHRDWRRPDDPTEYKVYWDDAHEIGFVLPRPEPGAVAAFYAVGDYYTHAGAGPLESETGQGLVARLLPKIAWRFEKNAYPEESWWREVLEPGPLDCLEIGCGDGTNLEKLRALGHRVTGVEPDPAAQEAAGSRGLDVHSGTAEAMPDALAGQTFDVVLMSHVLEHCIDPDAALATVMAMLKPGGKYVVLVPNNDCQGFSEFGRHWAWLDIPRHLTFFTAKSLHRSLEEAGFTILSSDYYGYARQLSEGWIAEQNAIAFAIDGASAGGIGRYLTYFVKTCLAAPEKKYDSIRVVARKA